MVGSSKRYLSLNYYINSLMRDKHENRLIKTDERFYAILGRMQELDFFKTKAADSDVVLSWEYAFLLLWLFSDKSETLIDKMLIEVPFERGLLADFLNEFKQELMSEEEKSAFEKFCEAFALETSKTLFGCLKRKNITEELKSDLKNFSDALFLPSADSADVSTMIQLLHPHYERPTLFSKVLLCVPTLAILLDLIFQKPSIKIARVKSKKMGEKTAENIRLALRVSKCRSVGKNMHSFFVICDFGKRDINEEVKNLLRVEEFQMQSQFGRC